MCLPLKGNSAEISWTPTLVKISRELSVDSKGKLKFIEEDEIAHCYWAPIPEPKTRKEALNGPNGKKWKASEDEESGAEQMLEMQFKCSKMGEVKYYLGMHVERDVEKGVLRLHQRKYCWQGWPTWMDWLGRDKGQS
ncbi:hypothetical protein CLOM_g6429 [Closterium sp. NIES-68]|nr:hypothetical protein CLOM_g6429 [Closterium sp. NIES-68]